MRKHLLMAGLLAALLAGSVVEAAGPRPKQQPANGQGPQGPISADQLPAGKYVGVVQSPPGEKGGLTVKMEYQKLDVSPQVLQRLNANAQRQYQQVLRLQQQLQQQMARPGRNQNMAATLQQLQRAIAQLQAAQGRGLQGIKTTLASVEVELPLAPDVKVRTQEPPQEPDDKGALKKYTPAELRALKGKDASLPGYPSTLDKLERDQKVQLTLVSVSRATRPPRDADPDGPPAKGAKAPAEHKRHVTLILILNGKTDTPADKPAAGKKP